ncbi:tetratricopeptide repeat protein [Marinimicrobium agarilyticum]|uniref:tetratricopeptide repeat protein n=1 Tax=Marinimicrobium agarilyticum TaxID=306546 RepID=UPI000489A387|nr:tetratricopeptide repeat protein [Marinimicrobium agarilyticum]
MATISVAASVLVLLTACGANQPKTIGSLAYTPPKEEAEAPKPVTHEEVREEYSELAELFEDEQLKEQIERRVADVYMMEGVQDQRHTAKPSNHYVEAIKAYRNILEKYPNSPDNAEVLYQLAKAYDLEGNQDEAMKMLAELTHRHPYYANIAEAHFRMGDIHFNNEDYAQAEASYRAVLESDEPRLATNARYMLGWSHYKQRQFRDSLVEFSRVLDELMAGRADVESLADGERPVAKDAIHSISLALDKVGGAEAIPSLPHVVAQPYTWLLYNHLGEYYREKELYEKAAGTFRHFIANHPNSTRAPGLHGKIIQTYIDGGFPSLALEEKAAYVRAYGIRSDYAGNTDGLYNEVREPIRTYLDELARYHYSQGQSLQKDESENRPELANSAEDQTDSEENAATAGEALDPEVEQAYINAADYYAEYAQTFPSDERIDEVIYLKSESLFLAQRYIESVAGYEQVAYSPLGSSADEHASDAGYAAIIAYQEHIADLPEGDAELQSTQARAVDSMLRFAGRFHSDSRAVSVLTNAAEYLFSLSEYQRALAVSSQLVEDNPQLDASLKETAFGIMAHSQFQLKAYAEAAESYRKQRELMSPSSEEYEAVTERLATALYRHSEVLDGQGNPEATVAQLLKIKTLTPEATLRVPSQYEAVTLLISLEQWSRAVEELQELIEIAPEHELAVEFPRRLAFAYEQQENWALAAERYEALASEDPDAETRREALFLAATMYENDESYEQALRLFREYANTYEMPTDTLMEARYKLAVNYARVGDTRRQLFWLDKLVAGGAEFADSDRNRWLTAWASIQYGDHHAKAFNEYRLSVPLVDSLPEKNALLQEAANRYQHAADQGILEFTSMSSFKTAELYRELASALRESPVPGSLSAEQRVVYRELIAEQALPFDDLASKLHQANIDRAWEGHFNQWIDRSFTAMRTLEPSRFDKSELIVSYGDAIR